MKSHKDAVCRAAHINLHEIDSKFDSSLNSGQRVFRSMSGSSAMADSQDTMHGITEANAEEASRWG
jgi:hypothetical protein